jgi:hypothetical protein
LETGVKRVAMVSVVVVGSVVLADAAMSHGEPTWQTFALLIGALLVSLSTTRFR